MLRNAPIVSIIDSVYKTYDHIQYCKQQHINGSRLHFSYFGIVRQSAFSLLSNASWLLCLVVLSNKRCYNYVAIICKSFQSQSAAKKLHHCASHRRTELYRRRHKVKLSTKRKFIHIICNMTINVS